MAPIVPIVTKEHPLPQDQEDLLFHNIKVFADAASYTPEAVIDQYQKYYQPIADGNHDSQLMTKLSLAEIKLHKTNVDFYLKLSKQMGEVRTIVRDYLIATGQIPIN